jgi:cardiolipin synthase A/B
MIGALAITAALTLLVVVVSLNFVTPEKKLQRAVEHRYAIGDPAFEREMGVLMGPSIVGGNKVTALQNGDEIFPSMLDEIAKARSSITFETYIYWSGEVGRKFTSALIERARAGVPVNVIIDWAGSIKMDPSQLRQMEEAGVRLHRYRPLHWYTLARINNRTHRKLLVIDGKVGFTGGVGIADQWSGHAQDPDHWRDIHFKVEGPAVAQMQAAFNDNWIKTTGEVLNGKRYFPEVEPVGDVDAHLFISSPSGGSESMHLMYLMALAAAQQSVDLEAAYFVPDDLILKSLIQARRRGVKIRILLPGEHIDSDAVRLASKAQWGPLLMAGVEIHEYRPTMMHNKMLIVDRMLVSVGSTNFDIRSFKLNDEASLNIYDHDFARAMTAVFEDDLAKTAPYTLETWNARPFSERAFEKVVLPVKSQL